MECLGFHGYATKIGSQQRGEHLHHAFSKNIDPADVHHFPTGQTPHLVNTNTFKKFTVVEMKQLAFELDKVQKEARSEQPAGDDTQAIQKRGRKLGRITTALQILNQSMMKK